MWFLFVLGMTMLFAVMLPAVHDPVTQLTTVEAASPGEALLLVALLVTW